MYSTISETDDGHKKHHIIIAIKEHHRKHGDLNDFVSLKR